MDGDRHTAILLERQTHIPRVAPMRLINHEDEYNAQRVIAPIMPYANDQMSSTSNVTLDLWRVPPLVNHHGDQFCMDLKMLMFIARQPKAIMP